MKRVLQERVSKIPFKQRSKNRFNRIKLRLQLNLKFRLSLRVKIRQVLIKSTFLMTILIPIVTITCFYRTMSRFVFPLNVNQLSAGTSIHNCLM